jgi:hypothetical protein
MTSDSQAFNSLLSARQSASREAALERLESASREVDELIRSWGATEEQLMAEIAEIRRKNRAARGNFA